MAYTIPSGNAKGTPLESAETKDIKYWIGRMADGLKEEPNGRFSKSNREWIDAAKRVLAERGDNPPKPKPATAAAAAPAQSTALAKRSDTMLAGSVGDPNAVTARLREFQEKFHLVSPATSCDAIPEGCGVALSMVFVDPNPGKDGPGEVYQVGDKLGLSGTTLARIGAAAGVDWDPEQSRRLDDGRDPKYVHFRAVGRVRNFDGSIRTLTGEVEIDAREGSPVLDEIREKAKRRAAKSQKENDDGASQILELRKFLLRHAERKAKNRAIADMGVKRSYAPKELEKPFAVARLMWTGQSSDPEIRREFAMKQADAMIGGMSALYGRAAALPAPQQAQQLYGHPPPPPGAYHSQATAYDDEEFGDYEAEGESVTGTPAAEPAQATGEQPKAGAAEKPTPKESAQQPLIKDEAKKF